MVEETEKPKSRLERKIESIATMPYWIKALSQRLESNENNQLSPAQVKERHEAWVKTFLGNQNLREDFQNSLYDLMTTVTYPEKLPQGPYDVLENIHLLAAFLQPELDIFLGRIRKGSELESEPMSMSGKNLAKEYGKLVTSQLTNEDMAFTQTDILEVLAQLNIPPYSISPKREALLEKVIGFSKADVFSHLRKELNCVSKSDKGDNIDFEEELALVSYWCNGFDPRSQQKAESRASMIIEHPLYVKPSHGARAYMVMSLHYNSTKNELSIKSTQPLVHELIRVANSNHLKSIIESIPIPTELNDDYEIQFSLLGLNNIDNRMAVGVSYSHYEGEDAYYEVYLNDKVDYATALFGIQILKIVDEMQLQPVDLKEFPITAVSEHETVLKVTPDKLVDVLYELDGVYMCTENNSYAETKINSPLVNGKVWETRSIVQSLKAFSPNVTATYCKVGDNDVVANIAVGGEGHDPLEIISAAYQAIRPEASEQDLKKLTHDYLKKVDNTVIQVAHTISMYLFTLAKEQSTIPFVGYASDISVDCMGNITPTKNGLTLEPIVIDSNISYAYTGLKNEQERENVRKNKIRIGYRFADDLSKKPSVSKDFVDAIFTSFK